MDDLDNSEFLAGKADGYRDLVQYCEMNVAIALFMDIKYKSCESRAKHVKALSQLFTAQAFLSALEPR